MLSPRFLSNNNGPKVAGDQHASPPMNPPIGDTFTALQQEKRALFAGPPPPSSTVFNPLDQSPIAWSVVAPTNGLHSHRSAALASACADGPRAPDPDWREALAAVRAASVALIAERQELKVLRSQTMAEEDEILAAVQATREDVRALTKVRRLLTVPARPARIVAHLRHRSTSAGESGRVIPLPSRKPTEGQTI